MEERRIMTQKLIIPITPTDFQKIEEMVSQNNDTICPYCDKKLEKYIFKDGVIVYLCYECGTVWKKEIIDENNFCLSRSEELIII